MSKVKDVLLKVVNAGSGGVGKSALTIKYMYNEFVEDYEPTKADSYQRMIDIGDDTFKIDILDMAGQEDYASIRDRYYRSGQGFLLVYSVVDPESCEKVSEIREQILRVKESQSTPMVLVANKMDIMQSTELRDKGKMLAQSWGIPFIETSAKTSQNVEHSFKTICNLIKDSQVVVPENAPAKKKTKKKCNLL